MHVRSARVFCVTDSTDWHGVAVNLTLLCLGSLKDLRVHENEPFEDDMVMDCMEHQVQSYFGTSDGRHRNRMVLVPYTTDECNIEMLAAVADLEFP